MWADSSAEAFLAEDSAYSTFARAAFEQDIAPILEQHRQETPNPLRSLVANYSGPGASTTGHRLFPGALYLLLCRCVRPGTKPEDVELRTAAAIELAHNSTLIHDDNLDDHAIRRGHPTIVGRHGPAASLLAGNVAILGCGQILVAASGGSVLHRLHVLCDALEACCWGQWLDEPTSWQDVPTERWLTHWLDVCEHKLRVGDVGAYLVAALEDGMDPLPSLFTDFSVCSQIINDFNDLHGRYGYHAIGTDGRSAREEAARKPTLPMILIAMQHHAVTGMWSTGGTSETAEELRAAAQTAGRMLEERKQRALCGIEDLGLKHTPWLDLLRAYVSAPVLPL